MTEESQLWCLLENLAEHYINATSFGTDFKGGKALYERVRNPQVGDFVLVRGGLAPAEHRIGTLVEATEKTNEYDKVWKIRLLSGEEIEWSNVKVNSFPVGNPYADLLRNISSAFQPA